MRRLTADHRGVDAKREPATSGYLEHLN